MTVMYSVAGWSSDFDTRNTKKYKRNAILIACAAFWYSAQSQQTTAGAKSMNSQRLAAGVLP